MIPHSLHNNISEVMVKYHIFSYYFLSFFSSFNRKYLKLVKMDIGFCIQKSYINLRKRGVDENYTEDIIYQGVIDIKMSTLIYV